MPTDLSALISETSSISESLDRLPAHKRDVRPVSTYRMQFNAGFRFADARPLVSYLHALGVSHLYSSPLLKARHGSTHGYDITDYNQLNPEIGSYEEGQDMVRELNHYGMGLVVDFVPNHMGIGLGENPWWQDVLANGRASEFARFFDLDWNPLEPELRNKILLPILGNQYGAELESGRLRLVLEDGAFQVAYYNGQLPLDPQTIPIIFESLGPQVPHPDLCSLLSGLRSLPPHSTTDDELVRQRRRAVAQLGEALSTLIKSSPDVRSVVEHALELCNGTPGDPHSFDCLHGLLEAQVYHLAHWRVSGDEINYRRFFDINDLIGLRMEDPRVFADTHQLLRRVLGEQLVQGIRLDHCDGLLNPRQYLVRLQMLYAASQCVGPTPRPPLAENGIEQEVQHVLGQHDRISHPASLYTVVEKILQPGEDLPSEWPVDGTTGYDFTSLVNNVFVDQRSERLITNTYSRFTRMTPDFDTLLYNSKKRIMNASLASEVNFLAHLLDELSLSDRYARDYTAKVLRDVIQETIACFPVYRTYIDQRGEIAESDHRHIHEAIERARLRNPDMAPASFDFLRDILLLRKRASDGSFDIYPDKLHFTLRFQQLSGPVMAKGLEDTVSYVYNRFISLNEVGSSPKQFGITVEEFHHSNAKRQAQYPLSMLATSTHDTKRSGDVRARLNVLSEMPKAWAKQVFKWRNSNRRLKRALPDGRNVPDLNEEYFLYQTLVGSWPFDMKTPEARTAYTDRIQQYMSKVVHEAKVNLSWLNEDLAYVEALKLFIEGALTPGTQSRPNNFLDQIQAFIPGVAFFGAINSLAQQLLMITVPGNPDIYQGSELWDFSLVDPDNRRPVDYRLRQRLLSELDQRADAGDLMNLCSELLSSYQDGRVKLWTTMQALRLRRAHRELFHEGSYTPLYASGPKQDFLVSFAREHDTEVAMVAVPRFSRTLTGGAVRFPLGEVWDNTQLAAPKTAVEYLENVFTGEKVRAAREQTLLCSEVFAHFPVALLIGG